MRRILPILLAITMLLSLCAGCKSSGGEPDAPSPSAPQESQSSPGAVTGDAPTGETVAEKTTPADTLVVGTTRGFTALNGGDQSPTTPFCLIYSQLWAYDTSKGEYVGYLAKDWSFDDDVSLHIWLRDDITWHNGTKFTSADVMYTLDYLVHESARGKSQFAVVDYENCEVISDTELIIRTYEPSSTIVSLFASGYGFIVSKEHCEGADYNTVFWSDVVGTGPYKLVEFVNGDHMTFVRNEDYFGGVPAIENIIIKYYTDSSTMFMDFETGGLDLVLEPAAEDIQRVIDGEVEHAIYQTLADGKVHALNMSVYNEYLADPVVREAICYALDAELIRSVSWGNVVSYKPEFYLPSNADYGKVYEPYPYDPERAKQLLADAGYTEGEITLRAVYTAADTATQAPALEMIQSMLGEIGINVVVESYDVPTAVSMFQGANNNGVPECDLAFISATLTFRNPSIWFGNLTNATTLKISNQKSEEIDRLVKAAETTQNLDEVAEYYAQVQDILYDSYAMIPTAGGLAGIVAKDYIDYDTFLLLNDTTTALLYNLAFVE